MKYGKIRIEDGNLAFTRHMMMNSLPCKDIMWAYKRREGENSDDGTAKQMISNYLVIVTKRRKRYKFDMTETEVQECLHVLKALNPNMAVGFPKGGRISLQNLPNTRDLGALASEDGRHILPRRLFRSGGLYHASLSDQRLLSEEYHIKTVIDFRSVRERQEKPDAILKGVEYYHIPIVDDESMGISRENSMLDMVLGFEGDVDKLMETQYESFVRDQYSVKQYARFMDVLLHHEEGAALWHCSMGKDRVGVGTALLLCALGIPKDTIREDFMRTNIYLDKELEYMLRYLESKKLDSLENVEKISAMFKVKESYLQRVFDTIVSEYGSVERFLRRGLYLTPKTLEELKNKYLV